MKPSSFAFSKSFSLFSWETFEGVFFCLNCDALFTRTHEASTRVPNRNVPKSGYNLESGRISIIPLHLILPYNAPGIFATKGSKALKRSELNGSIQLNFSFKLINPLPNKMLPIFNSVLTHLHPFKFPPPTFIMRASLPCRRTLLRHTKDLLSCPKRAILLLVLNVCCNACAAWTKGWVLCGTQSHMHNRSITEKGGLSTTNSRYYSRSPAKKMEMK